MRPAARGMIGAALAALGFAALPEAGLACARPALRSDSPTGAAWLEVCRDARMFAMPGQGSDGPGVAVLRDGAGRIAGAVAIGSLVEIGHPPRWDAGAAEIPLVARLTLPAPDRTALRGWVEDRLWRLRNLIGVLPSSEAFR